MGLQGYQWAIILVIVLLLFGAPKLPSLARSLGQSLRIFKSEMRQMGSEGENKKDPNPAVEGRVLPEESKPPVAEPDTQQKQPPTTQN